VQSVPLEVEMPQAVSHDLPDSRVPQQAAAATSVHLVEHLLQNVIVNPACVFAREVSPSLLDFVAKNGTFGSMSFEKRRGKRVGETKGDEVRPVLGIEVGQAVARALDDGTMLKLHHPSKPTSVTVNESNIYDGWSEFEDVSSRKLRGSLIHLYDR
jgi:hypothetical protein